MATWRMGSQSGIINVSKVITVCGWGNTFAMSFTVTEANFYDFTICILAENNNSGYANETLNFCCYYY